MYFTDCCSASQANLQDRVEDLKNWRLLLIGQQQDGKVHLRCGMMSIGYWNTWLRDYRRLLN